MWAGPAVALVPGVIGGVRAFQSTAAGLAEFAYTPSLAEYQVTLDVACSANGSSILELSAYQRSLPILGQALHLRATGVLPGSVFVGAYELATLTATQIGCGCWLVLTGVGTGLQFVPGATTVRDWFLPIAANPSLVGVAIDVQGFQVDPTAPCFVMTTQRGTLVPGL
jgi:hypothetical protein